jgi:hypothetical protein
MVPMFAAAPSNDPVTPTDVQVEGTRVSKSKKPKLI